MESIGWKVIKGTPAASNPSDPSYTSGDIQNGDTPVQVPVYRAVLDGLTLESVDAMVPTAEDMIGVTNLKSQVDSQFAYSETIKDNVSVPNDNATDILSFTLAPGKYIIHGVVSFPSNATGYRRATLHNTVSSFRFVRNYEAPFLGADTDVHVIALETISTTVTYVLRGYQNSGGSLTCSGGVQYMKLNS